MNEFREEAGKIISSNGIDATEIIEKVASHIVNEATKHSEKDLAVGELNNNVDNGGEGTTTDKEANKDSEE